MNDENNYVIEARSYNLKNIASHNFWVLRDSHGNSIAQLHGLATDRQTNHFKPIGFFNDRLGFYEFKTGNNDPSFISMTQRWKIIFQADRETVQIVWNKASSQIESLNKKDLDYSPFGIFGFPITNSNSAYHLFARLMGIECCHFSGVLQPGINNSLSTCLAP